MFLLIIKILLVTLATLLCLLYMAVQFFQKLPAKPWVLGWHDYGVYILAAFIFGFGTDSYWGLLSFLPLWGLKVLCGYGTRCRALKPQGWWVEVDWHKLMPKGFGMAVPPQLQSEMSRIPDTMHCILPWFYILIALKVARKVALTRDH